MNRDHRTVSGGAVDGKEDKLRQEHLRVTVLLIGIAISTSACAFGNRTVTLNYPPEDSSKDSGIPTAQAAVAPVDSLIVLAPFQNKLEKGKLIGEVLNGYGMHTADVNAGNDIAQWATEGIRYEMEKAGYNVKVMPEVNNPKDGLLIQGEVGRVFCTAYLTYEGEVGLAARLELNGEEVFNKRYLGRAKSGLNWAMTAKSYNRILSLALQDAARQFVRDLNQVFVSEEKKPA